MQNTKQKQNIYMTFIFLCWNQNADFRCLQIDEKWGLRTLIILDKYWHCGEVLDISIKPTLHVVRHWPNVRYWSEPNVVLLWYICAVARVRGSKFELEQRQRQHSLIELAINCQKSNTEHAWLAFTVSYHSELANLSNPGKRNWIITAYIATLFCKHLKNFL